MSAGDKLDDVMEHYHRALDEFSRGDPEPVKAMYSHRDEVALANPFGPAVRGWDQVAARLEYASSRFSDGEVTGYEHVTAFITDDLACIVENEAWRARVGDRREVAPFDLRVTSTFRREDGMWSIAMPIRSRKHIQMDRYGMASTLDSYEEGLASGETSKAEHERQRTKEGPR